MRSPRYPSAPSFFVRKSPPGERLQRPQCYWLACMTIYTLRSFASSDRIVAVQRLSAETDAEALSAARDMVTGASAVYEVRSMAGRAPHPRDRTHDERIAPPVQDRPGSLQFCVGVPRGAGTSLFYEPGTGKW